MILSQLIQFDYNCFNFYQKKFVYIRTANKRETFYKNAAVLSEFLQIYQICQNFIKDVLIVSELLQFCQDCFNFATTASIIMISSGSFQFDQNCYIFYQKQFISELLLFYQSCFNFVKIASDLPDLLKFYKRFPILSELF